MLLPPALLILLFSVIASAEPTTNVEPKATPLGTAGCSKPFDFPATAGGASIGIQIGERRVRMTLPPTYKQDVPTPLILAFHDKNMTMEEMEETTKFSDSKLNPHSIVLYPEALHVSDWDMQSFESS